jgi:hypothetical protein
VLHAYVYPVVPPETETVVAPVDAPLHLMCVEALMLATKAVGCVIVADFARKFPVAEVTVTV